MIFKCSIVNSRGEVGVTTEIAVMNKEAIALATDSAVTIGKGNKFYNTGNKLFALSKYSPVGIMVYDNAEFMGYPIEIVVKEYRKRLGTKTYDTLDEYWSDFIEYLQSNFDSENNDYFYYLNVELLLVKIDFLIKEGVDKLIDNSRVMSRKEIQKNTHEVLYNTINSVYKQFLSFEDDNHFLEMRDAIKERTKNTIQNLIENKIAVLPDDLNEKVMEICIMILTKKHNMPLKTGIVIAGYGDCELYPRLISAEFMGIYCGKIKYNITHQEDITFENSATVIPFAQGDVIATFMNGIDYDILNNILDTIDKYKTIMSSKKSASCMFENCLNNLKKEIKETIEASSLNNHWGPIIDTVSIAPKEELAQMAETLVNLTSFRRKLSMDSNSQL